MRSSDASRGAAAVELSGQVDELEALWRELRIWALDVYSEAVDPVDALHGALAARLVFWRRILHWRALADEARGRGRAVPIDTINRLQILWLDASWVLGEVERLHADRVHDAHR